MWSNSFHFGSVDAESQTLVTSSSDDNGRETLDSCIVLIIFISYPNRENNATKLIAESMHGKLPVCKSVTDSYLARSCINIPN